MKKTFLGVVALAACVMMATAASAVNVDGDKAVERVFNDDPGSTLTTTPGAPINTNPANITIRDEYSGAFEGANRHDVLASADGGGFPLTHGIDDSFTLTTELTLTDGFDAPRKEAGIRINSPVTGDALFLVNSDAGEIVTFGGGAPFHIFGSNGGGDGYTPGDTILLGITYLGGGDGSGGNPSTIEFFINRGNGIETTGTQNWDNLEKGAIAFTTGVYAQGGTNTTGDFVNAIFNNTTYTVIPEPASMGLAGLGLLGLMISRRRRR